MTTKRVDIDTVLFRLLLAWPLSERVAEQQWRVVQKNRSWDIVLVIDGGYAERSYAEACLPVWKEELRDHSRMLASRDSPA